MYKSRLKCALDFSHFFSFQLDQFLILVVYQFMNASSSYTIVRIRFQELFKSSNL